MPTKSGNLDLFWKLSESKDNARIEAAFKIISNLHRGKKEEKEEFLEDFAYSLKRFVSGLASDRVNSRKGYFTVSFCLLKLRWTRLASAAQCAQYRRAAPAPIKTKT